MKLPLSAPALGLAVVALAGGSVAVSAATGSWSNDRSSNDSAPATVSQIDSTDDSTPGDISGPCDEAENANDPRCAGVGQPGAPATTAATTPQPARPAPAPAPAAAGDGVVHAGGGTVTYTVQNGSLALVSAVPNPGWSVEVEQSGGLEIEVDFRSGTRRAQVNVELEDGRVRERVRIRDEATGEDVRIEDGVVVRHEDDDNDGDDHDGDGDNSGSGSSGSGSGDDNSGSGSSGSDSDSSGSGSSGSGSSGSGSSGSG